MRTLTRFAVPSLLLGGVLSPLVVHAQAVDVEPPMPNVLILLDTSGSMTRKMGDVDVDLDEETDFPSCSVGTPADQKAEIDQSRWFAVVQALTGDVSDADIGCRALPRDGTVPSGPGDCDGCSASSKSFRDLYGVGTGDAEIYDDGYYIPFYQLMSGGCMLLPKKAGYNKKWHEFNELVTNDKYIEEKDAQDNDCSFNQLSNGVIDAYKGQVRFGLMTFDSLTDERVELEGGDNTKVDDVNASKGTYSYWFRRDGSGDDADWRAGASGDGDWLEASHTDYAVGRPPLCETFQSMEVGARGPAAPPWEGRMMTFGEYRASVEDVTTANENVEKVILSARPFGATPLAGMMADAADFILNDDTVFNPKGPAKDVPLGPRDDDLWDRGEGCRPFHVLLITDGEPNLDLMPDCTDETDPTYPGRCPFPSIVSSDYYPGVDGDDSTVNVLHDDYNIIFHVVGVSLETINDIVVPGPPVECEEYKEGGTGEAWCTDPDATAQQKTCCLLNSIESEGGGNENATYAGDIEAVKKALSIILAELSRGAATRTVPVFASSTPDFIVTDEDAAAAGHQMLSSLETIVGNGIWNGNLERKRFKCDGGIAVEQGFDDALGDDFGKNLENAPGERVIFTVVPEDHTETWASLRPHMTTTDGMTIVDVEGTVGAEAQDFAPTLTPDVLDVASNTALCTAAFGAANSGATECGEELLKWYTGQDSAAETGRRSDLVPDDFDDYVDADDLRFPSPLGAIYHSQPVIVGPPREFVRDEAYDIFAREQATRPTVVYAATVDGQLHAFLLADNTKREVSHEDEQADDGTENNELWTFVPPIVLPKLIQNVNKHALLLDGALTVKNVAYERQPADFSSGDYTDFVQWNTALVASSGNASSIEGGGYYFALDVTDPHGDIPEDFDTSVDVDTNPRHDTPKFLWQLSRDGDDEAQPLFGESVPAAAITTIFYQEPDSPNPASEVAVAILAGGLSSPPDGDATYIDSDDGGFDYRSDLWAGPTGSAYAPRSRVRDWGDGDRADRSLTIVRLDNGEILYRFRGRADDPQVVDSNREREVGFLSPISGTPVPFPGLPGQVSTKIFVGDTEGMLWVIDVTSSDPDDWTMKIAWDAYNGVPEADIELDEDDPDRVVVGPVETVPVVSVTDDNEPVVIFSTGSQESFYETEGRNYVISLTDPADDTTAAGAGYRRNWQIDLGKDAPALGDAVFPSGDFNEWGRDGQRVTGPLNIFDGVLYFSTFVPSEEPCEVGVSRIWGVDYDEGAGVTEPKTAIAGWNPDELDATFEYFEQLDDAIVFGVAIGQEPSCRDEEVADLDDPIFGSYSTFTSNPPGDFKLVVQTGRKSGTAPAADQPQTLTQAWTLTRPSSSVRVDGWASIVE